MNVFERGVADVRGTVVDSGNAKGVEMLVLVTSDAARKSLCRVICSGKIYARGPLGGCAG